MNKYKMTMEALLLKPTAYLKQQPRLFARFRENYMH